MKQKFAQKSQHFKLFIVDAAFQGLSLFTQKKTHFLIKLNKFFKL